LLGLAGWHPFEATKSLLLLGSIARLIRTSMARNAKQINATVGAEVFSLAQQQRDLSWRSDRNLYRLRAVSTGRAAFTWLCRGLVGGTIPD
jgi:hypothetical protein